MFAVLSRDLTRQLLPIAAGILGSLALLAWVVFEQFTRGHLMIVALRTFTAFGLAPLAWLLVNRLMLCDGGGSGAAAFYERLPVSRLGILLLRCLVAVLVVGGLFSVGVGVLVAGAAAIQRDLPPEQVDYFLTRSGTFLASVFAWLLLGVALGRHRHTANALLLGALVVAWRLGWTPAGPFAYPSESFRFAEQSASLPLTLAVAGALAFSAALLHCSRAGRRWQRPASAGDLLLAGAVASAAVFIGARFGERPFVLDGPLAVAGDGGVAIHVREAPGAQSVADRLAADLESLRDKQRVELPAVYLDLDRSLDAGVCERADVGSGAVLLRAAFGDSGDVDARLRAHFLREVLDSATGGRLRSGAWPLLLEGYPRFLVGPDPARVEQDRLRVAWALACLRDDLQLSPADAPAQWRTVRERLGESLSGTLAGWLLMRLASAAGADAVHEVMREALAARSGLGGGYGARGEALAGVFAVHRASWRTHVEGEAKHAIARNGAALEEIAAARPLVDVELQPDGALRLRSERGAGRVALLHALARDAVPPRTFDREDVAVGSPPVATPPYPAGVRWAWAVSRYVPALGCDVLLRPWAVEERAP